MGTRVLVDANVFVSRTRLDWLHFLRESAASAFSTFTTHDIQAEAIHALRRLHPRVDGAVIARRVEMMALTLDEVLDHFPGDLPFTGRDEADYHMHAAAVAGRADIVLTDNDPHDFTARPAAEPYEVLTADAFFLSVAAADPACLPAIVREQLAYWTRRRDYVPLDVALHRSGCPGFAALIGGLLDRP